MKITQEFTVDRPLPVVWAFFKDVPRVAQCLPGAEYTGSPSEGNHTGKVTSKLGPFAASFEGEAAVKYDDDKKVVRADGKGVDRKGNSRSKLGMDCRLLPEGAATKVIVEADVQLSGAIAQFGRTGLINEVASVLVGDFVRNAEAELGAPVAAAAPEASARGATAATARDQGVSARAPAQSSAPSLSITRLVVASITSWFRSLFRKAA